MTKFTTRGDLASPIIVKYNLDTLFSGKLNATGNAVVSATKTSATIIDGRSLIDSFIILSPLNSAASIRNWYVITRNNQFTIKIINTDNVNNMEFKYLIIG